MKLGVFDSGLGGLLIAKSIRKALPDIDMVYFGDTLHLPYGNRSFEAIYEYSKRAIEFLFAQDCTLIITACNTASAKALRKLQQDYLPNSPYADRRILGVVVPTLETAIDRGYKHLGVIATNYTIESGIYPDELKKIDPEIRIIQKNTPLLVPLIENNGREWLPPVLEHYLRPMVQEGIECLILGCTHFPFVKDEIQNILGENVSLISQDNIIPDKLIDYLRRHPEIAQNIQHNGHSEFIVSDVTKSYADAATLIYQSPIHIEFARFNPQTNSYSRGETS